MQRPLIYSQVKVTNETFIILVPLNLAVKNVQSCQGPTKNSAAGATKY